jgi:hypothetical protein
MARKLRTKPGRAAYRRRKAIVEPVFGQIMTWQNGRQLLLRGEDGARGEWRLLVACRTPDWQGPPTAPQTQTGRPRPIPPITADRPLARY